ncbi:MAG: tRNA (cytidine(34)-2'-O)-methyltransferase [Georgfuchsia sp.]
MFEIVLFEPEIPPNTGNVVRLAANAGCRLHLVEPLGFDISDRAVRRAGLDYAEFTQILVHHDWPTCRNALQGRRMFALTTKGSHSVYATKFSAGDVFVFGPETRGLPPQMLAEIGAANSLRLPMMPNCRSLNLSNAVAITVYEAWRQQGFRKGC